MRLRESQPPPGQGGDRSPLGSSSTVIFATTNTGGAFMFTVNAPGDTLAAKTGWPILFPARVRDPVLAVLDPEHEEDASLVLLDEDGWLHVFNLPNPGEDPWVVEWGAYGYDWGNTRGVLSQGGEGAQAVPIVGMPHGVWFEEVRPVPSPGGQKILLRSGGAEQVSLDLFDVSGRRVRRVFAGRLKPGENELIWDGTMESGAPAPSGVYWYRVRWKEGEEVRKVVVTR
jgi:hypothetical protein